MLHVHTCSNEELKDGEIHCADGDNDPPKVMNGIIRLAPGLTDKQIRSALSSVSSKYKVLSFESPVSLWGGFADKKDNDRFSRRLYQFSSLWCCVYQDPGHILYDFFWDQIPHTDRYGRVFNSEWKPTTGPVIFG